MQEKAPTRNRLFGGDPDLHVKRRRVERQARARVGSVPNLPDGGVGHAYVPGLCSTTWVAGHDADSCLVPRQALLCAGLRQKLATALARTPGLPTLRCRSRAPKAAVRDPWRGLGARRWICYAGHRADLDGGCSLAAGIKRCAERTLHCQGILVDRDQALVLQDGQRC